MAVGLVVLQQVLEGLVDAEGERDAGASRASSTMWAYMSSTAEPLRGLKIGVMPFLIRAMAASGSARPPS
ncbi:MAG: hypothetical protein GEV13_33650 [Rhodospirillales bacterium]|nr:hypothetical protein [Rhodospirillales bacterium]